MAVTFVAQEMSVCSVWAPLLGKPWKKAPTRLATAWLSILLALDQRRAVLRGGWLLLLLARRCVLSLRAEISLIRQAVGESTHSLGSRMAVNTSRTRVEKSGAAGGLAGTFVCQGCVLSLGHRYPLLGNYLKLF